MIIDKKPYEISYLITETLSEEEVMALHQTIKGAIVELEGTIDRETNPRKRRLAYDIKGQKAAYFVNLYISLSSEALKELEKKLKFEKNILRHLTLVVDRRHQRELTKAHSMGRDKFKKGAKKNAPEEQAKLEELDKKLEEILKKI